MVDFVLQSTKLRAAFHAASAQIERDARLTDLTDTEVDSLIAAILKVDWKVSLPPHIAERVVTTGYVEWGATPQFEAAEHGNHVAESCRLTDAHFGQQGPRAMHGVYGKGTDTIVCHTGTSPNSGMNACAIAGAWNWLVDLATADEEASRG
ncbi:MAG: hypothetical protein IIZ30_07460 [Sphingomonas sp.]|uniref:hypothetical protein n=1 Tax=Sphingomonas sp. TaxID=28214 RepID=UPI00257F2730|nr:hypothetical protein [Sphingomonas sp.]MBQ1479858.1 hypothetical protein [Sphingomonas sp.]